jgi:hypothetical protein
MQALASINGWKWFVWSMVGMDGWMDKMEVAQDLDSMLDEQMEWELRN